MDLLTSLSQRAKVMIVASALFLLTLSIGLLAFGENVITDENSMIQQAQNASRVDMLYSHPEGQPEGH